MAPLLSSFSIGLESRDSGRDALSSSLNDSVRSFSTLSSLSSASRRRRSKFKARTVKSSLSRLAHRNLSCNCVDFQRGTWLGYVDCTSAEAVGRTSSDHDLLLLQTLFFRVEEIAALSLLAVHSQKLDRAGTCDEASRPACCSVAGTSACSCP
jgi:hypothetical protein